MAEPQFVSTDLKGLLLANPPNGRTQFFDTVVLYEYLFISGGLYCQMTNGVLTYVDWQ